MLHSSPDLGTAIVASAQSAVEVPRQAETDDHLIELWVHGRSRHTQAAYRHDAVRFNESVGKTLRQTALADIQKFSDVLEAMELRPASRHRVLSAIKSLFAFGHRLGYLPFDVARPVRLPGVKEHLAERILDEGEVQRMLALELNPRNHVLLTLLYAAGLRVSELCALCWSDLQQRDDGGHITIYGKGNKTRTILLPHSVWMKLTTLRNDVPDEQPVFRSRKKGHLTPAQVWRIVRKAAQRAGIEKEVSCHWLRHAHASHALDRNAPVHLVQATLGHASLTTTSRYLHARPNDSSANYLAI